MEKQIDQNYDPVNDYALEGLKKAFDIVSMYKDQTDGTFSVIRDTTKTFFPALNLLLAIVVSLNIFLSKLSLNISLSITPCWFSSHFFI